MNIKKNFGKKIKEKRLERQLTQEQLAEKIGISPKSLSQIELGNNFVSAENLELICKALVISPKILFDFDDIEINRTDCLEYINSKINDNNKLLNLVYQFILIVE
ncbi:MAG: helix-turn-helix domain-containing protein [Candidatus Gastranaerophilales bacterium]|nr:helix-turn-helix domain-containing protein [Candidatus Gastranaerophilales bacterium]